MTFDVSRVRAAYPALSDGHAYLDGAGGTQVPTAVIEAIAGTYRSGIGNAGGAFPASGRADSIVAGCRRAIADLTGAEPDGVILGPNMTTLTYRLADTMSRQWGPGDEVVVSRLDHDANVRPWVQAAARSSATVRWAEVDASKRNSQPASSASCCPSAPGWSRSPRRATSSAPGRTWPPSPLPRTRSARCATWTACMPLPTCRWTSGRSAPTSTPPAPTSGPGRTSAPWWPTRRCWRRCTRTSWRPRRPGCPGRFERGTAAFADLAGVAAAVDHLAALDASAECRGRPGAGRHQRGGAV